jgi:hypothetical protein
MRFVGQCDPGATPQTRPRLATITERINLENFSQQIHALQNYTSIAGLSRLLYIRSSPCWNQMERHADEVACGKFRVHPVASQRREIATRTSQKAPTSSLCTSTSISAYFKGQPPVTRTVVRFSEIWDLDWFYLSAFSVPTRQASYLGLPEAVLSCSRGS